VSTQLQLNDDDNDNNNNNNINNNNNNNNNNTGGHPPVISESCYVFLYGNPLPCPPQITFRISLCREVGSSGTIFN
jgi:hypothetical protein